jgi:demethylmenaquinone methyltransferase/2-methoxy-6-polyprenyl-1,4-benzoquinol methylase
VSPRRTLPAWLDNFRATPDRDTALARYARLAPRYEGTTARIRDVRRRVIGALQLQPGETVYDVACGAGAMLPGLSWRVGPRGRVLGIEQCVEMASLAKAAASTLDNVRVLNEAVEDARCGQLADAVVLCYTHDVLQNPQALSNLFAQVRPGARVVAAGLCLLPWWGVPVNAWVLWRARQYLTTWHGLRAPWVPLLDWCPDLRVVRRYQCGTGYLAVGHRRSS